MRIRVAMLLAARLISIAEPCVRPTASSTETWRREEQAVWRAHRAPASVVREATVMVVPYTRLPVTFLWQAAGSKPTGRKEVRQDTTPLLELGHRVGRMAAHFASKAVRRQISTASFPGTPGRPSILGSGTMMGERSWEVQSS